MRWLIIASFVYILALNIIYFSRKRFSNIENNIFKILLYLNPIGLLIELTCIFSVIAKDSIPLYNIFFTRLLLVYYFLWICIFSLYVFAVSTEKNKKGDKEFAKYMKTRKLIMMLIFVIFTPAILYLPLDYFYDGINVYSYGTAVTYLNGLYVLLIMLWIGILFVHRKNIKTKKHLPIYVFILLGSVVGIIQHFYPWCTIMTSFQTFVVFLMFFTIENPDLHMLNELNQNKQLIEENYEANSSLIFSISQDVKKPIKELKEVYEVLKTCDLDAKEQEEVLKLKNISDDLNFISSNLLDVSTLDAQNIKISENKYNLKNVLYTVSSRIKDEIKEGVEYHSNVSASVPDILYGDEVKLKQILMTILLNSARHTSKGFIELNISSIVKYDACRLIITIEDSGAGMSITKVNELMKYEGELTKEEVKMLDNLDLNIKLVSKIVKLIGGHILIKSDLNKGTIITITLEQRIPDNKLNNKVSVYNSKKVLLVCDNKEDVKKIKNKLADDIISVTNTMYGKDASDKLKYNEEYDLIIIEDEMQTGTAYESLKGIRMFNKKIPVVILLGKEKQDFKDDFIKDGFTDYILKNKLKSEIERIKEKFL